MFDRFRRLLFLSKAQDQNYNQQRSMSEWQYFFLELCGTVCDALRRAGRVPTVDIEDFEMDLRLARTDLTGELLTAAHFETVVKMIELCSDVLHEVVERSIVSEEVLKVTFRCLGAVIELVEYVSSHNVWLSDDETENASVGQFRSKISTS